MNILRPDQAHGKRYLAIYTIGAARTEYEHSFKYNSKRWASPYDQAEFRAKMHSSLHFSELGSIDVMEDDDHA